MIELTTAEENYLKIIFSLSNEGENEVNTNAIAEALSTKPASVTDMIQKLDQKLLIHYKKYKGVTVSETGRYTALNIIRKQRLWKVFLVEKLKFNWDEVAEVADQLEHIQSSLLVQRLDEFLGYPQYDPHGDPIPSEGGSYKVLKKKSLLETEVGESGTFISVNESSRMFLQYLDKIGAYIGSGIKVLDKIPYDNSLEILVDNKKTVIISKDVASNMLISIK